MICPEQTCATCIWWERQGPRLANASRDPSAAVDVGTCQSRSPVVIQGNSPFPVSLFPTTHESRFCGEWEGVGDTDDGGGGETVVPFRMPPPANKIAA